MALLGVSHPTSSFCSAPPPLSQPTQDSLHRTGLRLSTYNATPRLGGSSGRMADNAQPTGYEPKTCIDVSSEYTPINIAVRRENFDIERDLKFSLFDDFDHLLPRAVGAQRSVARACVDEFGSTVLQRETSAGVRVDHRVLLKHKKPLQSDESAASVERNSSREHVGQILRCTQSSERLSIHEYLEKKAEMAIQGESAAQRRLSEVRRWEQEKSKFAQK